MDRYRFAKKIRDPKLKVEKYDTVMYPKVELRENDIYIISKFGDRLDTLAHKYYRDVTMWWLIAQANHLGKGSMMIEAGTKIRIPIAVEEIIQEFRLLNKKR